MAALTDAITPCELARECSQAILEGRNLLTGDRFWNPSEATEHVSEE